MADANRGPVLRGGAFRLAEVGTSTGTVTDASTRLPATGFWIDLSGYAGVEIVTHRTADEGSCTMDVYLEQYNPITEAYTAVQDAAGADIVGVQWTDGQTGERRIRLYPGILPWDDDGVLTVNTVDKWYDASAPTYCSVRVLSGGTSVSNVFSMLAIPLR